MVLERVCRDKQIKQHIIDRVPMDLGMPIVF